MAISSSLGDFSARIRAFMSGSVEPAGVAVEQQFEKLALDLFALQFEANKPYRRLCLARGASPESVEHWSEIPVAPTVAFKELELSCLPPRQRRVVFNSSGTTGHQPSRHFHSRMSLSVYEASLLSWFFAVLRSPFVRGTNGEDQKVGLAILTPPPEQAPHSSLVYMFDAIRKATGAAQSAFVGHVEPDCSWSLDLTRATDALQQFAMSKEPALIFGTAFSFVHLLDHLTNEGLHFELAPRSCVLETGGYKGRSRQLPKAELHGLISKTLGIPRSKILCEYGMSELSSQAYAVGGGPFHFPPWARVQVISAETGQEVSQGEPGLIRVFDLANVYSVLGIQTEDLAVIGEDGLELLGRAALSEARGCSLMAS